METNLTIPLLGKALDAAIMRQTAIANNIAQVNTPGYRSLTVNFEAQLQQASPKDCIPFYEQTDKTPSLDEQLAAGINNATHYRALIKGLNHQFAIMKLAIQGNRT